MRAFLRDFDWPLILQCVLGYGLALIWVACMILLLNGIMPWDVVFPLFT